MQPESSAPVIYYLCPEVGGPSGGVRRIYRHVEILARNGFNAAVLHRSAEFRPNWFSSVAPVSDMDHIPPPRDIDVLVLPEVCHQAIARQGASYRRVVMAMSWVYVYSGLAPGQNYKTFGITDVISGCEYVGKFIADTMGLSSRVIFGGIDPDRFRPAARKALQIACMPHKNRTYLHNIECAFRSQFPRFGGVPFVRLENVSHDRVAELLGESALFLWTGFPEAIPQPVLEAMASECIVVAYHGQGGAECMRHGDNCYVVPDADVLGASTSLGQAVARFQSGDRTMQQAARATALLYSKQREEQAVVNYWNDFISERRGLAAS